MTNEVVKTPIIAELILALVEWGKPVLCLYRRTKGRSLSAMISGSRAVTLKEYQSSTELPEIFEQFLQSK